MSWSATSKRFLNTSRDGDSTTFLDSLFQCLTILSVMKFFLIPNLNLPWHNLRPLPLILLLVTWEKNCPVRLLEPEGSGGVYSDTIWWLGTAPHQYTTALKYLVPTHSSPCSTGKLAAWQLTAECQRAWSEKDLLKRRHRGVQTWRFQRRPQYSPPVGNVGRAAPKLNNDLIEEDPAMSFPSFSVYMKSLRKVTRKYWVLH